MKSTPVYDYVVAGGGSAGCTLAARLCEDRNVSVCLIEAGGNGRNLFIRMPAGNGFVFGNPRLDWGFTSIAQKNLHGRQIYFPRGKGLGGTSNLNGMMYMRGVPKDYDRWRDSGLDDWGYSNLLPYFKRSECSRDRRDSWHGVNGPLKTEPSVNFSTLDRAFIDSAVRAGHRFLDDLNGPERTGVAISDCTVHKGVRQSSALAYLEKRPSNLTVLTGKHIHRIAFDGTRAAGVEMVDGSIIRADREVISCLGAFGSPQVLMLSGIGSAAHLESHGISARVDLPAVGRYLADHVDVSMQYGSDRMDLSLARFQRLDKAAGLMARWLWNGSGPGGGAFFSAVLFHAINDPELPDMEVFMTPMTISENLTDGNNERTPLSQLLGRKLLVRGRKVAKPGVQIDINLERPYSTGTVCLADSDPMSHPLIDPNYFSDERDLDVLREGVAVMREVMSQSEISQYLNGELAPWKGARSVEQINEAIRASAYTGHHPCSTVRMGGVDDDSALDANLCVRGVQGLRVCDASAMPTQITGNLNATVIAMAEKAADLILGKPPLPPEDPQP